MSAAFHALDELPDFRFAAERRRVDRNRAFSPDLELEFTAMRLARDRPLVRAACSIALLVAISRAIHEISNGLAHGQPFHALCAVVAACVVLAGLAWSTAFERHYLRWAQIILPARNVVAAAHFAGAALGQVELLMVLPMLVFGPFFFSGLRFRIALVSGVMTLCAFMMSAALDLPHPLALRCSVFLLVCLLGSAIVAWQYEKGTRTSFLERYLIAELAQRDALTGTRNRRSFDERLADIWRHAIEAGRTLAVVLIDVDHFKAFNDRYGHLAGDDALRRAARAVQRLIRNPGDMLARYGGEEFVAILQDVDGAQAKRIAEEMRRAVMDLAIEHRGSQTADVVTISIGIAAVEPSSARDCRGALQLADQALYQVKQRGRNGVELFDDAEYRMLVTGVFRSGSALTIRKEEISCEQGADPGAGRRGLG
jgi:diguanylate cyclase (GGDEF)-like protein